MTSREPRTQLEGIGNRIENARRKGGLIDDKLTDITLAAIRQVDADFFETERVVAELRRRLDKLEAA